eukprot:CAMPEP_0206442080 /NCGR_PEP_ID=MMETSP0324_2-20121206/13624_1 /ASSEMBLY_ACC=CAM_ASM_000836 /TAXON_ID=2866 /ORGANISM="Crypthecodinium cohnii, Strain Seligo" /LENGTH=156 /DNA_ID=CAMNT_0053909885 /DNA_START=60 /DNA_END=530 /DNA_ORIENTATION=+
MFRTIASSVASRATASGSSISLCRPPVLARSLAPRLVASERPRFSSITITFVKAADGSEVTVPAQVGQSILEVSMANKYDIEGACGGECACSTCHVFLTEADLETFPEPDDDEADMLDLAPNVTDQSRLGCQLRLKKENDGMRVTIPEGIVNLMAS